MKAVRVFAAAFVAAVVFLAVPGAGPAKAAGPDISISSPATDATLNGAVTITGNITQSGQQAVVKEAKITIASADGISSETKSVSLGSPAFSGGGASYSFNWTVTPAYNGAYNVTVSATGQYNGGIQGTQQQSTQVTRPIRVEIAPAKPTGVAAGPSETTGDVTVTWSPNKEPDLVGYIVLRSYAGAAAKSIGDQAPSSKPTFKDDLRGAPQGQYRYQIVAVRAKRTCSGCDSDGISSAPSAFSAPVTVRATAATTTTTSTTIKKPSGGGGGSTGGGGGGSGGSGGGGGGTTGTTVKGGTTAGGTSGGKVAPRNTGGFAPGGTVDLSQFKGLLSGGSSVSGGGGRAPEDEGTYDPTLGYDPSERPVDGGEDDTLITIGGASIPAPNDDWVKFIGAGSLMTALLVHVLWFKQQVDAIPLETITE